MKRKRTFQVACGLFNSCNQLGINFPFTTKPRGLLRMRGLTFALLLVLGCAATTERTFGQSNSVLHGKLSGSSLLLNWNSRGDLESSPALNGPWNTLSNVAAYTGSAVQTASSDKRFFRVRDGYRNGSALPFPAVKPLPRIQSASIQRLAAPTSAGDTKLEVVFEPGQNIGSSNYFVLDEQLYLLRDDGVFPDTQANNGIHTVIVPFSTNDMIAWNDHVAQIPVNQRAEPIFKGRAIVATNTLQAFDITNFLAFAPISFLPFPCRLGSHSFYDYRKTLIITDLSVVNDTNRTWDPCTGLGTKMGAWTFGNLMTNMANTAVTGIPASDFARNWLRLWEVDQVVNFDVVTNRQVPIVNKVIGAWLAASGGTNLDLSIAPFRLLAIVNRVDLRDTTYPYENAGECRFVFGVVDSSNPCGPPLNFTVIFEFGVPKTGCSGLRGWGMQWAALNGIPFGAGYNAALQAITDQVTLAGADPSKINQSAINQIRSNEILINPWDLREFVLGAAGYLVENTVTRTPRFEHLVTPLLTTYANDAAYIPGILADEPTVPLFYMGVPFLGAEAPTPTGGIGGFFWDGTPAGAIATFGVRRHLSLNTCNGCHGGETGTFFTHIGVRNAGAPSALSGFLTGILVPDPAGLEPDTFYNDIFRRTEDLDALVYKPCLCLSLFRPLRMVH